MTTLRAIDFFDLPGKAEPGRWPSRVLQMNHPTLDSGAIGTFTPQGFWFTRSDAPGHTRLVEIYDFAQRPDESDPHVERSSEALPDASAHKIRTCVYSDIMLRVTPHAAEVFVTEKRWNSLQYTVLASVAQCWRFFAIHEELDRLEQALRGAGPVTPRLRDWLSPGIRRETKDISRALRLLLLDLPRSEAAMTDHRGMFESGLRARQFRRLVRGLGLAGWRNHIDERVEVVETLINARVERQESHDHLVLEVLIVVVILADIALHAFLAFAGAE
jgi:hypothetical protein